MLTDEEMWQAVVGCDDTYNGKFFYSVKTVGVYCRPSCKSKTPLRKNVSYHETKKDAEKAGFRPCKRCRPDLFDYAPMTELAGKAKELIERYYAQREILAQEMKLLNASANHISSVFKQQYGIPPLQYCNQIRTAHAKKLLLESAMSIIDVAEETGFASLSAFYSFFKKQTGNTPGEFLARNGCGKR